MRKDHANVVGKLRAQFEVSPITKLPETADISSSMPAVIQRWCDETDARDREEIQSSFESILRFWFRVEIH